ncbi:MAG TPA: SURF1 family protein [Rubrivivax sp.]|nr:SURF1 family protein [Burkholderiales bacterium]HNU12063.1 SURF1 family protein [Rubrivivax sp.]
MTRGAWLLLVTLLLAAVTARLGFWQLERAGQKLALQAQQQARAQLPPVTLAGLPLSQQADEALWQRRASVEGVWAPQETLYLDNRSMNGRAGFFVLTPLLLDDGRAVLVQRGWLPRDARDRKRIASYRTEGGRVHVEGRIAPEPSRMYELGSAASGVIRQNVDPAARARETRRRLLPLVIVQDSGSDDGLLRQWPAPTSDVHRNYGYALQWFGLCALVIGLYAWFRIIQPRRRRAAR